MVDLRRLFVVAVLALPPLVSTCKSSSEAKVATTIVLTPAGPFTFGALGRTQQFTAVVKDQNGAAITLAHVSWSTSNAAAVTVDTASGLATAVATGTAQVTATSGSATGRVTVTVTQTGALITKVSGDAQSATVGQALTNPLIVLVNDSTGHPAVGVSVVFAVATGGGSVGTAAAPTSANGLAQSSWTLGGTAGSQTVTAIVAGATGSPLTFTATGSASAAASAAVQAGNAQTAATGTAVAVAPAVIVKDAFNNPTPGVTVTFAPKAGQGSVTGATPTTNASGIATVGSWTLSGSAGQDTLVATVTGSGITGNPVVFTATSQTPGSPANVVAFVGNAQIGLVGYGVNVRPAVRVTDAGSLPVPNATVTFAVTAGGGSDSNATVLSNTNGVAQVGKWTLGASAGVNTMTATVTGIVGPVTFADTGYVGGYDIQIKYFGPTPSAAIQAAMSAAVAKWQSIIYRPVGAVPLALAAGSCGPGTPAETLTVQNLLILAKFDSIDGPGTILGQAGPCVARTSPSRPFTVLGVMEFDTADVANMITNGTLGLVMLHEMGHVIGFGTLWNLTNTAFINPNCLQLPSTPPGTINDTYFSCAKGRAAFDSVGGTSYTGGGSSPPAGNKVPVENCGTSPYVSPTCGSGTVNGHWRELVMTNELMTGFINAGSNPLSIVSIAAQEDLGYVVNYAGADAYIHSFTAPIVGGGAPQLFMGDDIYHGPLYGVDTRGRIVRVLRP